MKNQKTKSARITQLKVRSSLTAGASLANCQQNLAYWQKRYNQMCLLK
jgi:hypothetical protein